MWVIIRISLKRMDTLHFISFFKEFSEHCEVSYRNHPCQSLSKRTLFTVTTLCFLRCSFASSGTQIWTYRSPYATGEAEVEWRTVNMSSVRCASLWFTPNCSPSRPIKRTHVHEFYHWWISLALLWFSPLLLFEKSKERILQNRPELHDVFHYWNLIRRGQATMSQGEKFSLLSFFNFLYDIKFFYSCHSFFAFFFNKCNNVCNSNTRRIKWMASAAGFKGETGTGPYSPAQQRFLFSIIQDPLWCLSTFSLTTFLPAPQQKFNQKKIFNSAQRTTVPISRPSMTISLLQLLL